MALLDTLQTIPAKVALDLDGATLTVTPAAREFSTGSKGYSWQGKVEGQDGRRYQVNITAVVINSKDEA